MEKLDKRAVAIETGRTQIKGVTRLQLNVNKRITQIIAVSVSQSELEFLEQSNTFKTLVTAMVEFLTLRRHQRRKFCVS